MINGTKYIFVILVEPLLPVEKQKNIEYVKITFFFVDYLYHQTLKNNVALSHNIQVLVKPQMSITYLKTQFTMMNVYDSIK